MPLITTSDTISRIYTFLDAKDALSAQCINKAWATVSSYSDSHWKKLCAILWRDKQNHPLERWARIPDKTFAIDEDRIDSSLVLTSEQLRDLEQRRNMLKDTLRALQPGYPDNGDLIQFENLHQLEHFKMVLSEVDSINAKLSETQQYRVLNAALDKKLSFVRQAQPTEDTERLHEMLGDLYSLPSASASEHCPRLYAPQSRIPAILKIHLEQELFLANKKQLGLTGLNALAGQVHIKELKSMLAKLNRSSVKMSENNISPDLLSDDSSVEDMAIETEIELLSWKQSYFASIRDAKRSNITYEELREQGDWLYKMGAILTISRFISGGYEFFNSYAFRDCPCRIRLLDNGRQIKMINIDCVSNISVSRTDDWGWKLWFEWDAQLNANESLRKRLLVSYDMIDGVGGHSGVLSHNARGERWFPLPLLSDLRMDPSNCTYQKEIIRNVHRLRKTERESEYKLTLYPFMTFQPEIESRPISRRKRNPKKFRSLSSLQAFSTASYDYQYDGRWECLSDLSDGSSQGY